MTRTEKPSKTKWFESETDGTKYQLPVYEMNDYSYVLDAIDVKKLEIDKEAQPRKKNDEQIKHLVESIKRKVLMQPLLVRYDKERDVYLITEGQHRYYACKVLGINQVPCIIYLDMNKALALLCGIEANAEDRARALSGGDMASKARSIIDETRSRLREQFPDQPATEERILTALGQGTKTQMRKYLVSYKLKGVLEDPDSLLKGFVADKQDVNSPVTTKNLAFFLRRLMRTEPADERDEPLRKDETANLVKLTNLFAEIVLVDKWNPTAKSEKQKGAHNHAKNICRRHPFEALGQLCAEILRDAGGAHPSGGATFCKSSDIDWKRVEQKLKDLLNSHIWDDPVVYYQRSVNDILRNITAVWKP